MWKVYEPRWPTSADGQWYWKSDTSSDELDGHYFFYPAYYDLCAETEDEKERVREVVRDLTDHLVEHGFRLIDHDGKPTRWAIYDPENLNHSDAWWSERGLKSLSILSYLAVAAHITGDDKYNREIEKLMRDHAYHTNALVAKIQFGPGSGNQSDDEMAVMCYYNLVKYASDDHLRNLMRYGFYQYYAIVEPERNPFFNFAYAAMGRGEKVTQHLGDLPCRSAARLGFRTAWTRCSVSRWTASAGHTRTVTAWTSCRCAGSKRAGTCMNRVAIRRGHLVSGKVLPVENRFFHHWNTDPWELDYGGDGRSLASGTVFLLPYYMGLYHGFIETRPTSGLRETQYHPTSSATDGEERASCERRRSGTLLTVADHGTLTTEATNYPYCRACHKSWRGHWAAYAYMGLYHRFIFRDPVAYA